MTLRVVIVCNALDDVTRQQRGITTDSPAASRKIFMLCRALRLAGVRPYIISLGRGRAGGNADYFRTTLRRVDGVCVLYAPFSRVPVFSELVSLFAPIALLWAIRGRQPGSVVFYNRLSAYLPSLFASKILGNRNFLDLEDGEHAIEGNRIKQLVANSVKHVFDRICDHGALLACSALRDFTSIRPIHCYYGTAPDFSHAPRFQSQTVSVLMGGTLIPDTGAGLLIDALARMRSSGVSWTSGLTIHVTGIGSCLADFESLAAAPGYPAVVVHGRISNDAYASILRTCDVGLALKLNEGALANTTFPSKVVEYAAAGMLVLTTDISDVRLVLGEGALYMSEDSSLQLMKLLERVVQDRSAMQALAQQGRENVRTLCSPARAGLMVAEFVSGAR